MTLLRATRGLPASGKSTLARAWVAEDPARRARINRDDLRAQLHGGEYLGEDTERQIVAVRDAAITALLKRGVDVICDDTNLPSRVVRDLRRLAVLAGAEFEVVDLTDVSLGDCILRNLRRVGPARVPVDKIRDMHARYIAGRGHPLPLADESEKVDLTIEFEPYVPKPGTPPVVLVDIDGTVARMVARSPFDETRVHEDLPNLPVIAAVEAMAAAGYGVVYCSGRTDACRLATGTWLRKHLPKVGVHAELFMRPVGDVRKDSVVKAEIFDRHIRDRYNVVGVFDDRDQVVAMWRSLGLTVFQVAEGNF